MSAYPAFALAALLACVAALPAAPARATSPPPPSDKWLAHCAGNLKGEGLGDAVVRRYCLCMAGIGEIEEMLAWSQRELERAYPPAHRQCHEAARRD